MATIELQDGGVYGLYAGYDLLAWGKLERIWPTTAEAWIELTEAGRARPVVTVLGIRRALRALSEGLLRVQVDVSVDRPEARRLVEALGFWYEGRMWKAGPNGEDVIRYVMLPEDP